MKIAFLSENGFQGKVPRNFEQMRTDFAWVVALDATHFNIIQYIQGELPIEGFDHVFIIFPKGRTYITADGSSVGSGINPASRIFHSDIVINLKRNNGKVHYIQEGPHWWWDNYEVSDQFALYGQLLQCDTIFAHNEYNLNYYRGIFPGKDIRVIRTLMIDDSIADITPIKNDKVIVGGNFARVYAGFESYMISREYDVPIWLPTSHAKRLEERDIEDINHLPRLSWVDWMKELSTFKYAVHLMPVVSAGTFSLNCAYFGIPCIGNEKFDTQQLCFPELSLDSEDIEGAIKLARKLKNDEDFYEHCSKTAVKKYNELYTEKSWKKNIRDFYEGI